MVYLIYDINSGLTKIGESTRPEKRFRDMKTVNPILKLLWYGDNHKEKDLHRLYSHKRVDREWFNLSIDEINIISNKKFTSQLINHNNTYKNTISEIGNKEIVCKWWSDELNIGVTESKEVYTIINDSPVLLKKEFHMNRPHFRIPGTSKRISDLRINKSVKVSNKIIQSYCPF